MTTLSTKGLSDMTNSHEPLEVALPSGTHITFYNGAEYTTIYPGVYREFGRIKTINGLRTTLQGRHKRSDEHVALMQYLIGTSSRFPQTEKSVTPPTAGGPTVA